MDWNHYRFRSLWALPAPAPAVYRALERIEDYPRWWPQVREVTRLDGTSGTLRVRSLLPYDLTQVLREGRRDPEAGVLEVALRGDIEGWARWTVTPEGTGTLVRYDQEVDVRKPLLRRLAVPGRAFFRANHTLMMRAGRRGLAAHLAAV
ncbi:SRPBCC family protein [Streptomyces sp. ISL-12]|uniref:SRPBCC family protein n=1 Tax=Streptomyces sp. ISL-12 TaxID=2819177 RepID=UPI001BE56876|nr:SRPBCC family protein [Streptomyces sp. ISL-12]MBT2412932.1 SRPBCC family protein [Streptomyces sp. ISL-12]